MLIKLRANWLYKAKKTINQLKENQSELSRHAGTTPLYWNVFFHTKKAIHLNELKVQQQENLWLTKCE